MPETLLSVSRDNFENALSPLPLNNTTGRIAYILLWFPLSSETFIFREVRQLREMGLAIDVYTLYGQKLSGQSKEMREYDGSVTRLGVRSTGLLFKNFLKLLKKRPCFVLKLMREVVFRRLRNLETLGENTWSFFAGITLADMAVRDNITLLHAPWANGPATAAWVASRISGIPFAFTGRAGDIYPQDGLLREKIRDAVFVRTNNQADVDWLSSFAPEGCSSKIHLVYNSLTLESHIQCECPMTPPYRVLAVGRFARTKGFPYLLTAMARLKREKFPVHLTLVGDGTWKRRLRRQCKRLGLDDVVDFPGFVPHDQITAHMKSHDMLVVPSVVHTNGDRDGIPNVIMEALSNCMPVIATDVCGIKEVIHNGKTGILIQQRDAAAIADAIRWMISHREKARDMARSGRSLVKTMFDAKTNIRALYNLYSEYSSSTPLSGRTDTASQIRKQE